MKENGALVGAHRPSDDCRFFQMSMPACLTTKHVDVRSSPMRTRPVGLKSRRWDRQLSLRRRRRARRHARRRGQRVRATFDDAARFV